MNDTRILVDYKFNETRNKHTARISCVDDKGFAVNTLYRYNRNEEKLKKTVEKVISKLDLA